MSTLPPSESWLVLNSGPGPAAENMAWDEALLECCGPLGSPVLRFYGWSEAAASFGYFQRYQEIARATALRPLVRRPTGGGLVAHDADWTYSVAVPAWHEWHSSRAEQSYTRMHRWLQAAFARAGLETELAASAREELPGQCFAGHAENDLLLRGRKIAGAAQRRKKLGLLIQGSVQLPSNNTPSRHTWEAAMLAAGTAEFGISWRPFIADGGLQARVAELATAKYSRSEHHQRR